MLLKELLFDYLVDKPELTERLIAAYAIGYTITDDDLLLNPALSFAEGPDDLGVVISYNTFAAGGTPSDFGIVFPGALAINPLTWTRSSETAPANASLGSYLASHNGGGHERVLGVADATVSMIDSSEVVLTTAAIEPNLLEEPLFGLGSFHDKDISLYYFNLRQNAENRAAHYLASNPVIH